VEVIFIKILIAGKGGTGKTSVAAALSLILSDLGLLRHSS